MSVITIRGHYGSDADEIAAEVARRLQAPHIGQELLEEVASRLGVSLSEVEELEKVPTSLYERILDAVARALERTWGVGGPGVPIGPVAYEPYFTPLTPPVTESAYRKALEDVVHDLASTEQVILTGRGTQVILRERERTFHIFITAPLELRAQRVARREGLPLEEARRRVMEVDARRRAFVKRYFKAHIEDLTLYDLVLNTGKFSPQVAVETIVSLAGQLG